MRLCQKGDVHLEPCHLFSSRDCGEGSSRRCLPPHQSWAEVGSTWSAPSASEWVFAHIWINWKTVRGVKWQSQYSERGLKQHMPRVRALSPLWLCHVALFSTPLHCLLALHIWPTPIQPQITQMPTDTPTSYWLARLLTAHSSSLMYSLLTPWTHAPLPNSWTHLPTYSPPPLLPSIHLCGPTPTPTFTKLPTQPCFSQKVADQVLCGSCEFCCETDESDLVTGWEGLVGQ